MNIKFYLLFSILLAIGLFSLPIAFRRPPQLTEVAILKESNLCKKISLVNDRTWHVLAEDSLLTTIDGGKTWSKKLSFSLNQDRLVDYAVDSQGRLWLLSEKWLYAIDTLGNISQKSKPVLYSDGQLNSLYVDKFGHLWAIGSKYQMATKEELEGQPNYNVLSLGNGNAIAYGVAYSSSDNGQSWELRFLSSLAGRFYTLTFHKEGIAEKDCT